MRTRLSIAILFTLLLVSTRAEAQFQAPTAPVPGEDFHVELGAMFWTPTPVLTLSTMPTLEF